MIIPPDELVITFARSSGKGGQNVNKTSTKVFVHWGIENSTVLTDDEKNRVRTKLANRINNEDELVVFSEEERSQAQNKELAISRLQTLVDEALVVPKIRRATRPTLGSKIRRIESKRMRSQIKTQRRSVE
ncbi:MAG: aminoacyl-tRNA hydrolase [Candidatus Magasanikbacteria bacterium]|nr:aminoacyl-tRNA hydrolase [Candidatus Magasanikbacteria bacterium]